MPSCGYCQVACLGARSGRRAPSARGARGECLGEPAVRLRARAAPGLGLGRRWRLVATHTAGAEVAHERRVARQTTLIANRPEPAAGEALVAGERQLRAKRVRRV